MSEWTPFGTCSATCGGGTQTRTRDILTDAKNGGAACPVLTDEQACNEQPCPPVDTDCEVGAWSAWSTCTETCGGGSQTRSRDIITEPTGQGKSCPALTDERTCNEDPCPFDCDEYTMPPTGRGGIIIDPGSFPGCIPDPGTRPDPEPEPEPVDCQVGAWGRYTTCSAQCGGGTQERSRPVLVRPSGGGKACPATRYRRICNDFPCPDDKRPECTALEEERDGLIARKAKRERQGRGTSGISKRINAKEKELRQADCPGW